MFELTEVEQDAIMQAEQDEANQIELDDLQARSSFTGWFPCLHQDGDNCYC